MSGEGETPRFILRVKSWCFFREYEERSDR